MTLRLLLADDHRIVRQGLRALLGSQPDFELVGEAADGLEAVRAAEQLQPDVLVLDLLLPGLGGLEVAQQISQRYPRIHIIILSMHSDEAYVLAALRAGAKAYVLKDSSVEELARAIRRVAAGGRYFSSPISERGLMAYAEKAEGKPLDRYETLTARERQVLQLSVNGYTAAEVARKLFISRRTVESHRTNAMRKLGARTQKELIRYAVEPGIQLKKP
jgi:DNA-binding NarL/FixJ family response regulator